MTVTLLTQKIHSYSKPVKSLTIKLPKTPEDSFYSRITFSTDSSTIKFNQPSDLYLAGDHCKNGAFTPKKSNKYTISVFRSVDNDLTTKKYYGNVTSLSSDGFSFKDETSQKKYYENVKKYILDISKGQIRDSSSVDVIVT